MINPGGNDPLSANYVTVKDSSSSRFNDSFDFSGLSYSSLQKFELQLTYKETNTSFLGVPIEDWYLRLPGDPIIDTDDKFFSLTRSGSWVTTTFTLSNGASPFSFYETNKEFEFWFSEKTGNFLGDDQFKLKSATLKVYGDAAAVPLPAAAWLFGSALLGMVGVGYRRCLSE